MNIDQTILHNLPLLQNTFVGSSITVPANNDMWFVNADNNILMHSLDKPHDMHLRADEVYTVLSIDYFHAYYKFVLQHALTQQVITALMTIETLSDFVADIDSAVTPLASPISALGTICDVSYSGNVNTTAMHKLNLTLQNASLNNADFIEKVTIDSNSVICNAPQFLEVQATVNLLSAVNACVGIGLYDDNSNVFVSAITATQLTALSMTQANIYAKVAMSKLSSLSLRAYRIAQPGTVLLSASLASTLTIRKIS